MAYALSVGNVVVLPMGVETFGSFLLAQGLSERTIGVYSKRVDHAVLWFAERDAELAMARPADLEARRLVRVAVEADHPRGTAVLAGLYLALRVSEIASMRWDRFDARLEHYTVTGKFDYTARLPVHQKLREALAERATPYVWLFPGSQGRTHVTPATVWGWVRDLGDRSGIAGLRPHQLRHTCLATMNDRTGDLRATSEFARHRRVETTMIYTRTSEDGLRKMMNSLDY